MLKGKDAFEILQIEKTNDIKKIKKAYASLVKQYHPEEDKEKWLILHTAYQQALEYAKCNDKFTQIQVPRKNTNLIVPKDGNGERIAEQEFRDKELEELMEQIANPKECGSKKVSSQNEDAFLHAFMWLNKMEKEQGGLCAKWMEFFQSETYMRVCLNEQFLFGLGRMIGSIEIDGSTERFLRQEVRKIRARLYDDIDTNQTEHRSKAIKYLENEIDIASKRYKKEAQDRNNTTLALIFLTFNLCPIGILILMWICSKLLPWLERLI